MTLICQRCGLANVSCSDCDSATEEQAAALWRSENPEMSVFACTADIQNEYRRRVLAQRANA